MEERTRNDIQVNVPIRTLKDLRLAKKRLKEEIAYQESKVKNNFLINTTSGILGKMRPSIPFVSRGVDSSLSYFAEKMSDKFSLNSKTRVLLTSAVLILTPIIASRFKSLLKRKKNK